MFFHHKIWLIWKQREEFWSIFINPTVGLAIPWPPQQPSTLNFSGESRVFENLFAQGIVDGVVGLALPSSNLFITISFVCCEPARVTCSSTGCCRYPSRTIGVSRPHRGAGGGGGGGFLRTKFDQYHILYEKISRWTFKMVSGWLSFMQFFFFFCWKM